MSSNEYVSEWLKYAEMDFLTAKHLNDNMYPKPLEIICYHCQQTVEKALKAALIANGVKIQKTHDLGLLAEQLSEYVEIDEKYIEMCDNITPYGIKTRYPQELCIEEHHVASALSETEVLFTFIKEILS